LSLDLRLAVGNSYRKEAPWIYGRCTTIQKDTPRVISKNFKNNQTQYLLGEFWWDEVLNGNNSISIIQNFNFRFTPEISQAYDSLWLIQDSLEFDTTSGKQIRSIGDTIGSLFFNRQGLISQIKYYDRRGIEFGKSGHDSCTRRLSYKFNPYRKQVKVAEIIKSNTLDAQVVIKSLYRRSRLISRVITFPDSKYYLQYDIIYNKSKPAVNNDEFKSQVLPFEIAQIQYYVGQEKVLTLIESISFTHSTKYIKDEKEIEHTLSAELHTENYRPYESEVYTLQNFSMIQKELFSLFEQSPHYREWYGRERENGDDVLFLIPKRRSNRMKTESIAPISKRVRRVMYNKE
jgi:hypothetical protein